jgi:hypothetical protein
MDDVVLLSVEDPSPTRHFIGQGFEKSLHSIAALPFPC